MEKVIEWVPLNKIKLNPKNTNKNPKDQIERLAKIIEYQGWRWPLLVWKEKDILAAGEGRYLAAKKLKLKEVPVSYQSFKDEDQFRAFVTSDNAIAAWADLDLSRINDEVGEFDPDFDIDLLGIKNFEIEAADKYADKDADEVPEEVETRSQLGDLWVLGEHRLLCGDSTNIQHVERLMGGEKADMVFTDPPYGVNYKGINNDSREGLEELLCGAFSNYLVSSNGGAPVYVFHSDKCADIFNKVFRDFFHFSSMIIWNKNSLTLSRTDYQSKHEPCLYGWTKSGTHKFFGDRKQTSVWDFNKQRVTGHTTPKPIELIEKALRNSSKSEGLVTDFFGGSGSTLIACEKTNRKCYMMELDPHYCDIIISR